MEYLGDYKEDATVNIYFTTHDGTGAPVAPLSGFDLDDFRIYKGSSNAQKTTTNGLSIASPFDSVTGLHCLAIDTSNDTGDASFWVVGNDYTVVLLPDTETVGGVAVTKVLGQFSIDNRSVRGIKKNAALAGFPFKMVSNVDHVTAVTGATVTATRMLDGATFAACANSVVEDTVGWYHIDLAAADTNGTTVVYRFTATGCDATEISVVTQV